MVVPAVIMSLVQRTLHARKALRRFDCDGIRQQQRLRMGSLSHSEAA